MPKLRQIAEIVKLMTQKECIRNVAVIAHIDHGKTTLTDALLAGAGLLSPSVAGYARVLDYLEEEQKRGITMKAANISLLYKAGGRSFVVNLVDTPGHVDFTGKVTRALRAVDGAIVVVDAVEEIMAQTEIVTRQALEERVRPVLFINKVDRLVTELQLNAEQIEKKFRHVIDGFNDLIELHGEQPLREKWKIKLANGDVAFGSALHGWGFTLATAKTMPLKFSDVIKAYAEKRQEALRARLPVYDAVFELVINQVPNPKEAQQYRIGKIWTGDINSDLGRAMVNCNEDGPAALSVTQVKPNNGSGVLATGRLFSGTVKNGDRLHLVGAELETTVEHVYVEMGAFREEVAQVSAGNVVAVGVPQVVRAGATLVDAAHAAGMVPFEYASYVSEPVVTVAVEPRNPKELPDMLNALNELAVEDPNLQVKVDSETGEYLLLGMGELHLEVVLKELCSHVRVTSSPPRVLCGETVEARGMDALARSPNKKNRFIMRVEPRGATSAGNALASDERGNNLVDASGKALGFDEPVRDAIVVGFRFACAAGPLCGEPVHMVQAVLGDVAVSPELELRGNEEVMRGVGKAFFGSFLTAKPVLLEPIYRAVISVPSESVGEVERILAGHRGRVTGFEAKGALAVVSAFVPVAESFGLASELRSTTSGRAFWQLLFDRWERVPQRLAKRTITEIRQRKGLAAAVPDAARFLEGQG